MSVRGDDAAWNRRRRPPPRATVDVADRTALAAAPDDVYARLVDVGFVASCLPGLVPGSLATAEGGAHDAVVRQTVMGVPASWQLRVTLAPDDARRHVSINLEGEERRLRMTMAGSADVTAADGPEGGCSLEYTGHVEVEGRLAGAGGPIIRKLVGEILERFVTALGRP